MGIPPRSSDPKHFLTSRSVTELLPVDTEETPFYYMFEVQCTSCREHHPNHIGVSQFVRFPTISPRPLAPPAPPLTRPQEEREIHGSRGEANLVWRCKNCQRESSASIKAGPFAYNYTEPATEQKILTFECRGCEFVGFKPDGEWKAKAIEKDSKFKVDLEDMEWYDYDDKVKEEVSVQNVVFKISR